MADVGNTETPAESNGPATATIEEDDSAISEQQLAAVSPEVLANTTGEYFRAWGQRIRSGESGALPIIVGLIVIVVFFQIQEPTFLTPGNVVNLLTQASTFVMFGTAIMFVLIISEIDLAIGYIAGIGAFVI